MLFRKDLGGGHKGDLIPAADGLEGGSGSDQSFSRANVSLNQAQHWAGFGQVFADFFADPLLGCGRGGLSARAIRIPVQVKSTSKTSVQSWA